PRPAASIATMRRLFQPRGVAVVGASERGVGAYVIANLATMNFAGPVVYVNPTRSTIGTRPCWPSLAAAPTEDIDVAVIAAGRDRVLAAIGDCVEAKIPAAIVFANGFAETDDAGRH